MSAAADLPGWPFEDRPVDARLRLLWLIVFAAGFAVITGLLLMTLFTPISYGDLTRIGQISERQFGGRRAPPPIDDAHLRGVPIDKADILVIGDSFSMPLVWQTALMRAGYGVTTTYWGQYHDQLCGDFDAWIAQAGFHGRLVVIQSVERLLKKRMRKSLECAYERNTKPLTWGVQPSAPAMRAVPGFEINWGAKLTSGLTTWRHTRHASRALPDRGVIVIDSQVKVRSVPGGCQNRMFSHRLCDRALFFSDDDHYAELTPQVLEQMRDFARAQSTVPILWAVIPDKTTTYVMPDRSRDFVAALRGSGLGPDLFTLMREARTQIQDLYLPNDTHLSVYGQNLLGQTLLQAVREKLAPPPAPDQ